MSDEEELIAARALEAMEYGPEPMLKIFIEELKEEAR